LSARAVLALDLGTTGVRALAIGADATVLARAWRPLAARYPAPGWIEQDPGAWWERSVEVLRAALAESGLAAAEIAAIGVVTQRGSAVAWTARGDALAPAIVWQDQRTEPRVRALVASRIPASTMTSSTKFEWLLTHRIPASARAGLRLGTPDVWLADRLSGGAAFATDASEASCTGLYDLARGTWHPDALALYGLAPEWLPAIVPSSAIVGETPRALLGAPIPIAARAGDQQAASFAQGVLAPGDAKLTIGTSAMLDLHTGATPAKPRRGAYPLALCNLRADARAFCLEGTVITAGAAIEWLVTLGALREVAALDALLAEAPNAAGVTFVPALQGLGTPHLDPLATGACFGITRGTTAAELAHAVVEGVAQRCADVCEALGLGDAPLRVDGGLARSRAFLQTLADATGRVLLRASESETTAIGAGLLAGLASGVWRDPADAIAALAPPVAIEPRSDAAARTRAREAWSRAIERVRG